MRAFVPWMYSTVETGGTKGPWSESDDLSKIALVPFGARDVPGGANWMLTVLDGSGGASA